MRRILEKAAVCRGVDLEAWETALRTAVLAAGARVLGGLIEGIGSGRGGGEVRCSCGGRMESLGRKAKTLLTILGEVSYSRTLFRCSACQATRYPGDEALDVVGTGRSPGLRRMMARAGSQATFKKGRDDLRIYAGIQVSAKDVERVAERIGGQMEDWSRKEREEVGQPGLSVCREEGVPVLYVSYDGVGVPMTAAELVGRRGRQADGSARTREAKLGCVFTQTTTDEKGFAIRDPESTSFVAAIESAEEFGWRIYGEAVRRGLCAARRVVIVADGAQWIRTIAEEHFPEAIQIIDLYHAREHVAALCKLLFGSREKEVVRQRIRWWTYMDEDKIERIIQQAKERLPPAHSNDGEMVRREINFLEKNKERMRYKTRPFGLWAYSSVPGLSKQGAKH